MSRPGTNGAPGATGEAFLTALDLGDIIDAPPRQKVKDERLNQVRKDHKKLADIVSQFGNKVGGMIDKQRYEFMNAYEQHIQDVQNELQTLREKVAEISGEETRKAKLKSLDIDQTRLKAEALRLDQEAVSLRKQMRKLVNVLHSTENDRNWAYKRLEKAKTDYTKTNQESYQLAESLSQAYNQLGSRAEGGEGENDNVSLGSGVVSNTSSQMTIQIAADRAKSEIDAKKRVDATYKVSREQALLVALPRIIGAGATTDGGKGEQKTMARNQSEQNIGGKDTQRTAAEKAAVAELVGLRARQESIRDFVAQCASNCDKGPWARIQRDPIEEMLKACQSVASDPDSSLRENERFELALQLVTVPETYFIISDMLIGKEKQVESSLSEYFGFGGEVPLRESSQEGMQMSAPQSQAADNLAGGMPPDDEEDRDPSAGVLDGAGDIMEYFRQSQEQREIMIADEFANEESGQ